MNRKFNSRYQIADVTLSLDSDLQIVCDSEFLKFETSKEPDYCITFQEVAGLRVPDTDPVGKETGFYVYGTENGYIRLFFGVDHVPYAISESNGEEKTVTVQYLPGGREHISHTGGAFFHIGWEDILLRERRLIFHACCVHTAFGGILFSGISGIGKSTQGTLWCDYEKAKMINGDRPVLYKKESRWVAYGSPYAGSSKHHVNEKTEIRAIVMLAQSDKCTIRKLGVAEAFRKVFAQMTVGSWNAESVTLACGLAEQLVSDVPVYELACTPDRNAVNLLKETLLKEVNE